MVTSYDWADKPDVRVWFTRKVAAGQDVWSGVAISRSGASVGDGVGEFRAWKRLSIGPVARVNGEIIAPAAVYVRVDTSRHYQDNANTADEGPTRIENHYTAEVGLSLAEDDTPLARIEMDEWRNDTVDEGDREEFLAPNGPPDVDAGEATYLPETQESRWSAGAVIAGEYTPLVGARTQTWNRAHWDVTNQGDTIFEWENERLSSAGVFVAGEYVPLVGARTWVERRPVELYPVFLGLEGWGSQDAGDAEASVGTFLDGEYAPLVGARYDDDFIDHHHDHRGMARAGTYLGGSFRPIVATTYDGVFPQMRWLASYTNGDPEAQTPWQTSAGSFTRDMYRPVVGTRFVPMTQGEGSAREESHQVGVYPLTYRPFIPIASIDYAGGAPAAAWPHAFVQGARGSACCESEFDLDVVAYTPDSTAIRLVGVEYRKAAPDADRAYDTHVRVGAWGPAGFTRLVGATWSGDDAPVPVLSGVALRATGRDDAGDATMSAGYHDPATGLYVPLASVDTAAL